MNITYLSNLINEIKSRVYLNYILEGVTEMSCQYLLSSLFAECVGDEYKEKNYRDAISELLKIKIDKKLLSYNRESCIKVIQNNLVELSDADYNEILESQIINIEDNTVYFNVDIYNKNNIKNKPQLRKYGVDEYIEDIVNRSGRKNVVDNVEPNKINEYDSELLSIWKQIESLDGFKDCLPLVWKLKISNDMYLKLKAALSNYLKICNIKKEEILQKYSQAIFVYTALWYRWEYNGKDQNENALKALNTTIQISDIWNNVHDSFKQYLYTSENGSNLFLYSLYVLGGFPFSYIIGNSRFDNIFKEIHFLNNAEYQPTDEHFQRVIKCFDENNQAYKQSFINGSFNEYIKSLLNDDIYVHECDYSKVEKVKKFKQLLDDGKRESIGNIFTPNYFFYYDSDTLECIFKLKIGTNKESLYIPAICLQAWSLRSELTEFYIGIETNTRIKSNDVIRFTRSNYGGDVFVGWGSQNQLEICLCEKGTSTINVVAYADYGRETILKDSITSFSIEDYFQVYATGCPFEWSDRTNNRAQSSLIFRNEKYELMDNYEIVEQRSFLGEQWNFVPLTTNVKLKERSDNKKSIEIILYKGKLAVTFKNTNRISYFDKAHSLVEYYNNDCPVERLVLLLGEKCIEKIRLYPFREGEKTEDISINNNSDLKISYKQENGWVEFLGNNINAGKLRLRIQYKNYTCLHDCYYIPTSVDELVRIDTDNYKINWGNPQSMSIYEPFVPEEQTSSDYIKQIEGYAHVQMSESENGKFSFDDKTFDTNAKVVPFLLKNKNENGYLCINTWRARKGRELYSYGKKLLGFDEKRKDKKAFEIDYILKDAFEVRSINTDLSNGNSDYGIKISYIDHFYFNPFCIPGNEGYYDIGSNVIVRKYATDNKWVNSEDKNIFKLEVGDKYKDEYQFYIWNMSKPEKDPIHVDSDYDEQKKILTLKPDTSSLLDCEGQDVIIVFQSLKGVKPNFYVAPKYITNTTYNMFNNKYFKNEMFLRCYKIACEHNIYFSQFWPLQKIAKSVDCLMEFIKGVFQSHHDKMSQDDFLNLQRFADEFVFDWLLLPHEKWKRLFRDYKDNIKLLFKHTALARNTSEKDYLMTLFDCYFRIDSTSSWTHVRNTAMKCIGVYTEEGRYKKNSKFALLNNDYERRKEILDDILKSETNLIFSLIEDINKQSEQ